MKMLSRFVGAVLIVLIVAGATVWGAFALWFTLPAANGIRIALVVGFVALGASVGMTVLLRRPFVATRPPKNPAVMSGE